MGSSRRARSKAEGTFLEAVKCQLGSMAQDLMQIKHALNNFKISQDSLHSLYVDSSYTDGYEKFHPYEVAANWNALDAWSNILGEISEPAPCNCTFDANAPEFQPASCEPILTRDLLLMYRGNTDANDHMTSDNLPVARSHNQTIQCASGDFRRLPSAAWEPIYAGFAEERAHEPEFSAPQVKYAMRLTLEQCCVQVALDIDVESLLALIVEKAPILQSDSEDPIASVSQTRWLLNGLCEQVVSTHCPCDSDLGPLAQVVHEAAENSMVISARSTALRKRVTVGEVSGQSATRLSQDPGFGRGPRGTPKKKRR